MLQALVSVCAWVLASGGTWAAVRYAQRRQMIDLPGARRSHTIPTPRGGGIGIVVALLAGACVAWALVPSVLLATAALGLLLVAGVGWLDDHRHVRASVRLLVHAVAGLAIALVLLGWPTGPLDALAVGLAAFWVMALVNVWNFMDGINGIATLQATVVALALALLPGALEGWWLLAAWALAGACLGFLPWNFPRARIFLGDVGSGALGYAVAVLVLLAAVNGPSARWPLLAVLPVAFLIDAGLTLTLRYLAGRRWWEAHRSHLYQWATRRGHSHALIAYVYSCVAAIAAIMVAGIWESSFPLAAMWVVFMSGLLSGAWYMLRRKWLMDQRARRSG